MGPFPSGMREHPLLASPLYAFPPLDGTHPDVDFALRPYGEGDWPSAYPTGGRAQWASFKADDQGEIAVSFPEVDWKALRGDHGWASVQYRTELRGRVAIPDTGLPVTRLRIDVLQAAEYAFIPAQTTRGDSYTPVWYNGDVYAFGASPNGQRDASGGVSNFARSIALPPGEYIMLVRALYECRMFGDPGDQPPTIRVKIHINRDDAAQPAVLEPGVGALPDIVDGKAMGQWAAVGVRVPPGSTAAIVDVDCECNGGFRFTTPQSVRIAPGQMRPVPLKIDQAGSTLVDGLKIVLRVRSDDSSEHTLIWSPRLTHVRMSKPFRFTFASPAVPRTLPGAPAGAPALVSLGVIVPPTEPAPATKLPPVLLALHGAGVEVTSPFWVEAMPTAPGMWAVLPSGRNEWGEDWHGGSMVDVWAARDALPLLAKLCGATVSTDTLLAGHSNGGQGAWHAAARYPDRIVGLIAFAGYLKIQDYVPFNELVSHNYADPALMGLLLAALAPYNNDLYASNLASVPVLAVHGAADDNVPPRHGRTHAALVAAWTRGGADIQYVEVPHKGHWWEGGFAMPKIQEFIATLPPKRPMDQVRRSGFTLASANPDEAGGKAGIRIAELAVPGRLARLDVNMPQWNGAGPLDLHGSNVKRVEIIGWAGAAASDSSSSSGDSDSSKPTSLVREDGVWRPGPLPPIRAYGPVMRLLASDGPVTLVVPAKADDSGAAGESDTAAAALWALATLYAHDLYVYHRLDAVIVPDGDALRAVAADTLSPGSVVVFGAPHENRFTRWMMAQERTPCEWPRCRMQ